MWHRGDSPEYAHGGPQHDLMNLSFPKSTSQSLNIGLNASYTDHGHGEEEPSAFVWTETYTYDRNDLRERFDIAIDGVSLAASSVPESKEIAC